MTRATEIYVNAAPCGTTNIHLYAGSEPLDSLKLRGHVLTYLKGNKTQKGTVEKPFMNSLRRCGASAKAWHSESACAVLFYAEMLL